MTGGQFYCSSEKKGRKKGDPGFARLGILMRREGGTIMTDSIVQRRVPPASVSVTTRRTRCADDAVSDPLPPPWRLRNLENGKEGDWDFIRMMVDISIWDGFREPL